MKRRQLLRSSAAALGGGAAAVAGLRYAGDASAETALTLDVLGDSATLGADETVTAVSLSLTVEWAYDLPDSSSPETSIVEIAAGEGDGALTALASAESAQLFTESDGTESFDVGLLGDVLSASDLAPEAGERETDVTVEARLRVEDAEGKALARESTSDTATVTVTRDGVEASEYGSVGGSGSLTIETTGE